MNKLLIKTPSAPPRTLAKVADTELRKAGQILNADRIKDALALAGDNPKTTMLILNRYVEFDHG